MLHSCPKNSLGRISRKGELIGSRQSPKITKQCTLCFLGGYESISMALTKFRIQDRSKPEDTWLWSCNDIRYIFTKFVGHQPFTLQHVFSSRRFDHGIFTRDVQLGESVVCTRHQSSDDHEPPLGWQQSTR